MPEDFLFRILDEPRNRQLVLSRRQTRPSFQTSDELMSRPGDGPERRVVPGQKPAIRKPT